jgi:proteasome lid subunit RPN8/RPN11
VANIKLRPRQHTITRLVRPRPDGNEAFEAFISDDGFGAYVHRDVLDLIARHARVVAPDEAIGLLSGRICHDPKNGPYTIVIAAAAARGGEFKSGRGHVELLAVGHDKVRRRLEDAHPDREVVGWYHTHPQQPPIFSTVDEEEQATWNDPGHIGIVYSGIESAEPYGVYRGPDASLLRRHASGVPSGKKGRGSNAREESTREPEPLAQLDTPAHVSTQAPAHVSTQAPNPNGARSKRRRRLKDALLYLVALLLVCLLGGLYWLHYRVQSVEARLRDFAAERARDASADNRPEQPRQIVPPTPAATPPVGSTQQAERQAPLDVPELLLPSNPLSTTVTSGTPPKPAKRRDDSPRRDERRDKPAKKTQTGKKPARSSGQTEGGKSEKPSAPKAEATPSSPRRE